METQKISFIGGGRITKIFLTALENQKVTFQQVSVMDTNPEVLKALSSRFPQIKVETILNESILGADYIFLAVHPPMIAETLEKAKAGINPKSTLISLAPKFTIEKMTMLLGGHNKIVRLLPLASSIIGKGYNPVVFSSSIDSDSKKYLLGLFKNFGHTLEVAEPKIEGYAIIVAMGPTYLWFQMQALREVAAEFGLSEADVTPALKRMVCGAARTLLESGLTPGEVMDLIPVKPLAEMEAQVGEMYRTRLPGLYQKIKP